MTFYLSQKPSPQGVERICETFGIERSALEFGLLLRLFFHHWERTFETKLLENGLGGGRFSILLHLYCSGPSGLRPSELAAKMGVTRGNLTGLLAGLEKMKLVGRVSEAGDRRSSRIQLKDKARQLMKKIGPSYFETYAQMQRVLTKAQAKELHKTLDQWADKLLGTDK